jgi:hypothetical protein
MVVATWKKMLISKEVRIMAIFSMPKLFTMFKHTKEYFRL